MPKKGDCYFHDIALVKKCFCIHMIVSMAAAFHNVCIVYNLLADFFFVVGGVVIYHAVF